jgi:hypothetical protein
MDNTELDEVASNGKTDLTPTTQCDSIGIRLARHYSAKFIGVSLPQSIPAET